MPDVFTTQVIDGAWFLLRSPVALALGLLAVLVARRLPPRGRDYAPLLLTGAMSMAAPLPLFPAQPTILLATAAVVATLLAAGVRLPRTLAWAALAVLGLFLGMATGLQLATPAEALGTMALALFALIMATVAAAWATRWTVTLPRLQRTSAQVLAAWLGAVSWLSLALHLKVA